MYSLRMWRWSSSFNLSSSRVYVFSTYVEVILKPCNTSITCISILHVCGGDPYWVKIAQNLQEYSPRMWRWSRSKNFKDWWWTVFSTYVEVILTWVYIPCYLTELFLIASLISWFGFKTMFAIFDTLSSVFLRKIIKKVNKNLHKKELLTSKTSKA